MNQTTPSNEREVSPRLRDFQLIGDWLLRHPFAHFAIMFCYWFTATSLLNSLWVHGLHAVSWTEGHIYFFAFFMSVFFYFYHRRRLKLGLEAWLWRWVSRLGLRKRMEAAIAAKKASQK